MQNWIKPKVSSVLIIITAALLLIGVFFVENFKQKAPLPFFDQQVEAAELMSTAMDILFQARSARGINVSLDLDPNRTGLIGYDFTEITTTTGYLDSKRTATNPDFAALLVKFYHQAELKEQDYLAIGGSGSFPSLILASLCAAKVMDLNPILIYSVGASMYGANILDFTFVDMLQELRDEKLLPYEIAAISMGGFQDRTVGLYGQDEEIITEILQKTQAEFIYEENLAQSIAKRKEVISEKSGQDQIKAFVNVGGASANVGTTALTTKFPLGLIKNFSFESDSDEKGLVFEYGEMGIPIIHLLNIRGLAIRNGMPIDPVPLPRAGISDVYFEVKYLQWAVNLLLVLSLLVLVLGRVGTKCKFYRRKDL